MVLIHGGDIESYRLEYGRLPLDFSANCNPLGVPAGVKRAIRDAAAHADAYPDPLCRKLCALIADKTGTLPERVLCGNGAADLIYRAALACKPKRALVPAPSFAEYELALRTVDCEIIRHPLRAEEDFALASDILPALKPDIDMLFLCNPNNPTGLVIDPSLLRQILETCEREGILLIVDECFNGFLEEPEIHTLRHCFPNIKIFWSSMPLPNFTAWPGCAWAIACPGMKSCLKKCAAPDSPGQSPRWRRQPGLPPCRNTITYCGHGSLSAKKGLFCLKSCSPWE